MFSLTPGGFKFQVKLEGVESNGNGNDADLNGNGETKAKESKAAKQEDSEAESEQEEKPKKAAKKQQVDFFFICLRTAIWLLIDLSICSHRNPMIT